MSSLRCCPKEFYFNCENRLKKCGPCAAGFGSSSGPVYYIPIENTEELAEHPHKKDYKKIKRLKEAKRVEKAVEQEIVRGTIRSGAALGDGDLHILGGSIRQEVKDRGKKKSWNLTWDEYEKGKKQGISTYAISVECPDGKRRTMFMMEDSLFTHLLSLEKHYQSIKNEQS